MPLIIGAVPDSDKMAAEFGQLFIGMLAALFDARIAVVAPG
jgi:hypothetical protein